MKLQDYAPYYIGCRCFNTWLPEGHEQYDNGWILGGFILNSSKPYCLENEDKDTWTDSIKPILRLVEDMTDDDIKLFFEYDRLIRLYRDVSFSRFMGGITVNYSVETEDEGWYPQSYDFHFHKLSSLQLHRLLKAGFDMFSLIKNGLAVDSKTLM